MNPPNVSLSGSFIFGTMAFFDRHAFGIGRAFASFTMKLQTFLTAFLILPLLAISFEGMSQYTDPREAKEYFENGNYLEAMKVYKKLIEQKPEEPKYFKKLGVCHLRTYKDRNSAAKYLEQALKKDGHDEDAWYYLGKAYMKQDEYKKASKQFTKYQANSPMLGGKKDVAYLQGQCRTGKELIKHPLDVSFNNLGPAVNTKYPDYYPFVAKNESRMVFTSRRRRNEGSSFGD